MARPIGLTNLPAPPTITMASRCSIGGAISRIGAGAAASGASPWSDAANTMLAFPFVIESPALVNKFFWVNGSAAGGNTEMAVLDSTYTKLGTSTNSVAGSGNSVPQAAAPTGGAFTIPPGLYYCAIAHSATTTNQLFRWSLATTGGAFWMSMGCFKVAAITPGTPGITAGPFTPADLTNVAFPVCGIITRTAFDV